MIADITTIQNLGHEIKGLVHVGANDGEEVAHYLENGIKNIALFEPLDAPYQKALDWENSAKAGENIRVFPFGWAEKNQSYVMHITENDKASSVLELVPHGDPAEHPVLKDWNMGQLPVVGEANVLMVRYDDFVKNSVIEPAYDPELYDCLVMDVQGMELQALKGMGSELDRFKYLIIELSEEPVYLGEAAAIDVCEWLCRKGFEKKTDILPHDNVLFIKREDGRGCDE